MSIQIDYSELDTHKHMLGDFVRCEAFRRALRDLVTPQSAVLDAGAGSGVLSIFAAQAGARVVYAVERSKAAHLAEQMIADNDLSCRIKLFHQDMADVVLPEQVDVIVSEFMGGCALDENLLPMVVQARDRWLKRSGKLIPNRVTCWMAPVWDTMLDAEVQFWNSRPYGVGLGCIAKQTTAQLQPCRYNVVRDHLLSAPQPMWDIDLTTISLDESSRPFIAELQFVLEREGICNGLATWFEADLSSGNTLSNRPSLEYTHWGRLVIPVGQSIPATKGLAVNVRLTLEPAGVGQCHAYWQIEIGDYSAASEDAARLAGCEC